MNNYRTNGLNKLSKALLDKHKQLFETIAKELNILHFEDWYKVQAKDVHKISGATGVLNQYYGAYLPRALMKVYPEHKWQLWRFSKIPRGFWNDEANVRSFIRYVEERLHISTPQEWNNVSFEDIKACGGQLLWNRTGGLSKILSTIYPEYSWTNKNAIQLNRSKVQLSLYKETKSLFPGVEVLMNHPLSGGYYTSQFHESAVNRRSMELDVYVPSVSLALEFQGNIHFSSNSYPLSPNFTFTHSRDSEKKSMSITYGITLIEIPYWWDRTRQSLGATVHKFRPDLLSQYKNFNPIPEHQTSDLKNLDEESVVDVHSNLLLVLTADSWMM